MDLDSFLKEITQEHAPHLHKALEELCQKAGIAKPVICERNPNVPISDIWRFTYDYMAGALHFDKPRIILGERARAILSFTDVSQPVSEELRAVLAHELSHLKHGDVIPSKAITIRFLTPLIGMAAAMGGVALYNHHKSNNEKKGVIEDSVKIGEELNEQLSLAEKDAPAPQQASTLLKIAKYAAAGAAGFVGGQMFSKMYHNHIEYRADKFSAELMGSGEPLAKALEKFRDHMEHKLGIKQPGFLKSLFTWHPDVNKRIETLRGL